MSVHAEFDRYNFEKTINLFFIFDYIKDKGIQKNVYLNLLVSVFSIANRKC